MDAIVFKNWRLNSMSTLQELTDELMNDEEFRKEYETMQLGKNGVRVITKEKKDAYLQEVYAEMRKRGFQEEEIPKVIGKTGFLSALEKYPEEQLHYEISDVVDEIITMAARFDYTKWQHEYYDKIPPETLRDNARKYNEEYPFKGKKAKQL